MNPQLVEASKLAGVLEVHGNAARRGTWVLVSSLILAFASQAALAQSQTENRMPHSAVAPPMSQDLAVDLVAQFDSLARYCAGRDHGKADQYSGAVRALFSQASTSTLERLRETSDYERVAKWDQFQLTSHGTGSASSCAGLLMLAPAQGSGGSSDR